MRVRSCNESTLSEGWIPEVDSFNESTIAAKIITKNLFTKTTFRGNSFCNYYRGTLHSAKTNYPENPHPPNFGGEDFTPQIWGVSARKHCKTSVFWRFTPQIWGVNLHPPNLGGMGFQGRDRPQKCYKNNCFREFFCNNFGQDGTARQKKRCHFWASSGRLIFIHLQCWQVLPFSTCPAYKNPVP